MLSRINRDALRISRRAASIVTRVWIFLTSKVAIEIQKIANIA
jgi:hypothetical protein